MRCNLDSKKRGTGSLPWDQRFRAQACLDFIAATHKAGYAPTVEEVRIALGLVSKATTYRLLLAMRDAGMVTWQVGKARTLRIRKEPQDSKT